MRYAVDGKKIFLRMDHGEDFHETLKSVLKETGTKSAIILGGIGMLMDFEIGWFNVEKGEYENESVSVPHELLSVQGNVSEMDGEPFAHVHVSLAGPSRSVVGGHLFRATVCNTVEMFLEILEMKLYREEGEKFRKLNISKS